jgi:hypothetical protein
MTAIKTPYAYAWYLTALKFPDYVGVPGKGLSPDDKGGWVKFSYVAGASDFNWHTSSDGQLNDGPLNRVDKLGKEKAGMMYAMQYGQKELKYLQQIETSTHLAIFSTSNRMDGKEVLCAGGVRSTNLGMSDNGDGTYTFTYQTTKQGAHNGIADFPGISPSNVTGWQQTSQGFQPYYNIVDCDGNTQEFDIYHGSETGTFANNTWFTINGITLIPI